MQRPLTTHVFSSEPCTTESGDTVPPGTVGVLIGQSTEDCGYEILGSPASYHVYHIEYLGYGLAIVHEAVYQLYFKRTHLVQPLSNGFESIQPET